MVIWVAQFNIVAGQTFEDGPFTGAFPQRGGSDEACDLYLLVEPALPGSEEFCNDIANLLGESFHRYRLSVTGGLLRALQSAHADLRGWNSRSLRDQWVAVGVSALAVRGTEGYLAQVGPALAYAFSGGRLRLLQPHIPDARGPLGLGDSVYPQFSRLDLAPGDAVLLAATPLHSTMQDQALAELLAGPMEDCLPAIYQAVRSLPWFGAVLLVALEDRRP
ncbi:MAG TPA: hypothetical protein VNL95_01245 [Dehalococcoidia bacterium]|nr:hypothetical protein [Dehalococcoidia bacterium]